MKKIGDLVSRFKNFVPPEKILKRVIAESIEEETKLRININHIDIGKGIVRIQNTPGAKLKILLKKHKILDNLNNKLGSRCPRDIV